MSSKCPYCANRGEGYHETELLIRKGGKTHISERWLCHSCGTVWLYVLYTPRGSYQAYERTQILKRGTIERIP